MKSDHPGPARWTCPGCGYDLVPRLSTYAQAEHQVQHREADLRASRMRGRKVPARELLELLDRYRLFVMELKADRQLLRARVRDLEDQVQIERDEVGERDQRIAELYSELDRQLG